MKRKFSSSIVFSIITALLFVSIYSCSSDDDTVTPTGPADNTINGTVIFVDTNFILSGGTYLISAYPSTAWPPMAGPTAYDTLHINRNNNILNRVYSYTLKDISPGSYVISVGFRKSTGGQSPIMSVYGCDTARAIYGSTCFLNPPLHAIIGTENQGVQDIDMVSWSDTAKKVY